VSDLIGRFGDHRGDAASAQLGADGSTRVGLVGADQVRAGAWCTGAEADDFQMRQQMLKDWGVVGLAGRHQHHQWSSEAIDEVPDLAGQPAAGPANTVVRRLDARILVVRPSPPCGG